MSEIMKELSKQLSREDIEFRIGNVQKGNNPTGFSLLAYKTARTDVKRLNEVLGLNWSNEYFYDSKGILSCSISVYDNETKQWITRSDVGTESMTEKEKGSYSDAFKRAGFKWGIGLELYRFPFIWIKWNDWSNFQNKFTPKNFDNKSVKIKDYVIENGEVKTLVLEHKGKVIYSLNGGYAQLKQQPQVQQVQLINQEQVLELEQLISEHKRDKAKLLTYYKINKLDDIPLSNYATIKAQITAEKK